MKSELGIYLFLLVTYIIITSLYLDYKIININNMGKEFFKVKINWSEIHNLYTYILCYLPLFLIIFNVITQIIYGFFFILALKGFLIILPTATVGLLLVEDFAN